MYLTPKQKRKNTITIIILLLGIPLTVFAAWQVVQLLSRASGEAAPKDIVISNISTNSVCVGWVTEISSDGAVVLVENGSDSSQIIDKRGNEKRKNHYVELSNLEPNAKYTFAIISSGERYEADTEGTVFSFTTAPISASVPTPNPVYGSGGAFSKDDFIVYIINKSQSSFPVSVVPNASGGWAADLSGFRATEDFFLISVEDSDELEIVVISGVNEGDIIEGSFSEVFDSKGQLREVYSLVSEEDTSLMNSFPDLKDVNANITDNTDNTDTTNNNSSEEEDNNSGDIVVDNSDDDTATNRSFRIIHDIDWVDMVNAGENLNIVTGKDSVMIANLRDTGFDIVWLSEQKEKGNVLYGSDESDIAIAAKDIRDSLTVKDEYYVHYVEVEDLDPETKYYFEVHSGNDIFDGFEVTTFEILSSAPPIGSISGEILNIPSDSGAVVVGLISDGDEEGTSGNSQYAATMSDSGGGWILSIADVRNADGSGYFNYTDGDTIELSLLCYGESVPKKESTANIEDRDIELEVSQTGDTVGYTKIPLLDNYSVLGIQIYSPINSTTIYESDNNVRDVLGVETESVPNTGILDSVFGRISLGIGCVVLGIGVWRSAEKKKEFSNN